MITFLSLPYLKGTTDSIVPDICNTGAYSPQPPPHCALRSPPRITESSISLSPSARPLLPEPGALKPLSDSCSAACFQGKEPLHKLDLFLVSGNGTLFITRDLLLYFQVLSLEAHVQGHVMHESRDSRF